MRVINALSILVCLLSLDVTVASLETRESSISEHISTNQRRRRLGDPHPPPPHSGGGSSSSSSGSSSSGGSSSGNSAKKSTSKSVNHQSLGLVFSLVGAAVAAGAALAARSIRKRKLQVVNSDHPLKGSVNKRMGLFSSMAAHTKADRPPRRTEDRDVYVPAPEGQAVAV